MLNHANRSVDLYYSLTARVSLHKHVFCRLTSGFCSQNKHILKEDWKCKGMWDKNWSYPQHFSRS